MKIDAHTHNLLLSLAHLGMADVDQLRWLHFPALAQGTAQNRLTAIGDLGLIEQRPWAIGGVRQRSMWVLTVKGQRLIASDPAYPGKPIARSDKLFNHDRRCIDVIVRCIEIARQSGLAGAQVVREVRLDRRRARPKADALLFLETRRGAESVDTVPWAMGLPLKEEQPWRVAIEAETGSQAVKIAAEKATAYREVYENAEWRQQWGAHYGPPPIVYLVCASTERAAQIATAWREHWPGGHWAITGDEGLAANRWHYHSRGQSRPGTALRFRTREDIAEANAREEATKAKAAAERQAEIDRKYRAWEEKKARQEAAQLAVELEMLDERKPRTPPELAALLPWEGKVVYGYTEDWRPTRTNGVISHELGVRFNATERALWAAYAATQRRAWEREQQAIARGERWDAAHRWFWPKAARVANWVIGFAVLIILLASSLRVAVARDWIVELVAPLASAGQTAATNGGVQCVQATEQLELRNGPSGAVVGQIDAGDQVWMSSRRQLADLDPRTRVQVYRIEQGRVVWSAWIEARVKKCGE